VTEHRPAMSRKWAEPHSVGSSRRPPPRPRALPSAPGAPRNGAAPNPPILGAPEVDAGLFAWGRLQAKYPLAFKHFSQREGVVTLDEEPKATPGISVTAYSGHESEASQEKRGRHLAPSPDRSI
jgi:hypothetical protein